MKRYILMILSAGLLTACSQKTNQISPDRNISAKVSVNESKSLVYEVSFNGKSVIGNSRLGIIVDNDTLGNNAEINLISQNEINKKYITRGFHNAAIDHCNEYIYEIKSCGKKFKLQTRVYNDGFAYRYLIPGSGTHRINGEISSFGCPVNTPVWFFERPNEWKLKTYAGEWTRTMSDSLHKASPNGPVQGPVLLYELNQGGYMAITEAALYNYSGMRLEAKADASLHANFSEADGFEVEGNIVTPWRVIILAEDLTALVNTDLVTSLNPEPDKVLFADTDWIKPGRSVWSWWSEPKEFMTVPFEKHMIDRAAELGFEYTTIDEGWERWTDKWNTLKDICNYAAKKNVGVFVWKHSAQINSSGDDYKTMRMFFDSVSVAGAKGLKIDFMNAETKALVDFDIRALQLAAERKLLINFHGCQKPTGEFRTYPNELTREGIRGLELNKMNEPIPANHNVALVFTRCILNNNDYTPVGFSNPANTSWAHQLATAYAFTSPLLTLAEHPDTLFMNPEISKVLPFIKDLPTVWDETLVLDGSSVSETAILARRKAGVWYLAVLNGDKAKTIDVKPDFLGKGEWQMTSVEDVAGIQKKMNVKEQDISADRPITLALNASGGFVAKFTQK